MGKYIVMYVLPALVLLAALWRLAYWWYTTRYGQTIKRTKVLDKKTEQYEMQLGIPPRKKKRR